MKLNGWKRIGIIASALWVLGAGYYTYIKALDESSKLISDVHIECDSNLAGKTEEERTKGFDACNKEAADSLAISITNARLEGVIVAFVPVPLAWAFVYLVIWLVGWVQRGFIAH